MEYYGHLTYLCTILFFAASFGFLGALFFENFIKIKKPLEKNYYLRFRPTSILELISECVCSTFQNGPFPIIDGGTATSIFRCLCVIVHFTFFFGGPAKGEKRVEPRDASEMQRGPWYSTRSSEFFIKKVYIKKKLLES